MNQFAITTVTPIADTKPVYEHGFTPEEVSRIKTAKEAISSRDLIKEPVTLEEFKTIIVPWNRIHRTEAFILNPPKTTGRKTRAKKEVAPKIAKPKKLTKKAIEKKVGDIIFKQAMGEAVSEEELSFLAEHTKGLEL